MELQDILEKVSALYRKFGIRSITMDDVAREIGISKKTLYLYVTDKTDLVKRVVEHVGHCNFESLANKYDPEKNAIEDLIEVSIRVNSLMKSYSPSYYYDLEKYYPDIFRDLMVARRKIMYESMLENIRKGKNEGLYRNELDEEIIAKLHLLRIENLQENEIFSEEEIRSTKFFREMFVYHIRGLATDKGIRVLNENIKKLNHTVHQST